MQSGPLHERHVTSALTRLGFSAFFADQLIDAASDIIPARVVGQHRREWDVTSERGTARAVLAGKHWAQEHVAQVDDAQPTVGDWVGVRWSEPGPPIIEVLLKRKSSLTRTSASRRGARQTLVANVDHVAVVAAFAAADKHDAVAKRSLHPRRIERYVTAIEKGGAEPIVLLNKADLVQNAQETAKQLEARLKTCRVVCTTCKSDDGLDPLLSLFRPGTTIGLVGLSGVGKSSLVNRILGRDAQKVGEERAADARGRHTTTHRELFLTESGLLLIDTPGMRDFAVADGTEDDLQAFEDIIEIAKNCQFRDCRHQGEPGCAVRGAVNSGQLVKDRLDSFVSLAGELKETTVQPAVKRIGRPKRQKYPKRNDRSGWDDE
jgi:ribosome biogenesis GTPase / thiamine phosphate phosphatase